MALFVAAVLGSANLPATIDTALVSGERVTYPEAGGLVVAYFPPDLVPRLRAARIVEALTGPGLWDEGDPSLTRGSTGRRWKDRLRTLLADTTAYQRYSGISQKKCSFREDVRVRLEDGTGPFDLRFCFGCSDLLVLAGERSWVGDFSARQVEFLDLMISAFPNDARLREYRNEEVLRRSSP